MMPMLGCLLIFAGSVLLAIAAWGVLVLEEALVQQHAATKAGTLALAITFVGVMLVVQDAGWTLRLLLIIGFLLATLPVGSHLLARAAIREAGMTGEVRDAPMVPSPGGSAPASSGPRDAGRRAM